ncbi:hypothetical protein IMAU80174_02960 [Lactiplantibacillus plantarum]|uniref:HNH endonuclease n=2 Tax=Lactobacillaceae TaxID=33958 RepID=UPI0007E4754F|nr:HNH endonuclease [Lactiplantibacillus plantarum]RDG13579.1 hypothetical protein DQM08_01755 [Lactiplantibacillus paraplantarum]ANJ12773.1 hypothetical protein A8704_01570 [Lactiplantibacillus plantarum]MCB7175700.1 HNH endonuclease [Lactiplantibacillus plantarum]MCG0628311.1 hypothetical protein [Lactiplantibacillus plantarum]MCG0694411.1 hypothetical protein [Lactiplantibacillus plantarum]
MIHINRLPRPSKLTDEMVKRLTQQYKDDGTSVWNKPYIKDTLLEMTHHKCCYCEAPLNERGGFMEVEHVHPKHEYPDEVLDWENLLPICKNCNINKSSYDTKKHGFVDPSLVDPKDYFQTKNYRYIPKNDEARATRNLLRLNSADTLVSKRITIGNAILDKVENLLEDVIEHQGKPDKLLIDANTLREVLKLVQPDKNYSAIISSILLNDQSFNRIKVIIKNASYWDTSLEDLEKSARQIAFDEVKN